LKKMFINKKFIFLNFKSSYKYSLINWGVNNISNFNRKNKYNKKYTPLRINNQKIFFRKKSNQFFYKQKNKRIFFSKFLLNRSLMLKVFVKTSPAFFYRNKLKKTDALIYIKNSSVISFSNLFFHNLLNICPANSCNFFNDKFVEFKAYNFCFYTNNALILNFTYCINSLFFFKNLRSFKHLISLVCRKTSYNALPDLYAGATYFNLKLKKLVFYKKNIKLIREKDNCFLNSKFFFFKRFPSNFFKINYYFNTYELQFKKKLNKSKTKLTLHPVNDFNASTREAFFYTITLHFMSGIDGQEFIFSNKKLKAFFNRPFNNLVSFYKNKRSLSYLSNFKKSIRISNFFYYSGKNTHFLKKSSWSPFNFAIQSIKKNVKKNKILKNYFANIFFFNSFNFSSKFFFKNENRRPSYLFLKKSDTFFQKFNQSSTGLFNFSRKMINLKKISNFSFFFSNKEIFFFFFSKPSFFKFFFWNFKNIFKKNLAHTSSVGLYFSNLYKSFFQNNKNFQYSNVIPQGNTFLFKYKRLVHRDFSSQIIDMRLTNFFFDNISYFLEYCCGKKIMFNNNSFLMTYLEFDERASCALWTPKLRVFRKMLGPRLFLNESLTILYICIKLKDPYLLSAWLLNLFYKISFWKYKLLFRYLYYVLKYFMWNSVAVKYIKGLRFQLKGKVSVAGNARTRTVFTSIGATGNGNLNKRVLTNLNLLKTFTGVISFRTWLSF